MFPGNMKVTGTIDLFLSFPVQTVFDSNFLKNSCGVSTNFTVLTPLFIPVIFCVHSEQAV